MGFFRSLQEGLVYGAGEMSDSDDGLAGLLVKLTDADATRNVGGGVFELNDGGDARFTPSFGVLANDTTVRDMPFLPAIYYGPGIYETDVYAGSNPTPGDGLYAGTDAKLTTGYDDVSASVKATLDTGVADTDLITWQAREGGTLGNQIAVVIVESGANTSLSVSVTDLIITVNLATTAQSAAKSTVAEVIAALEASSAAMLLVSVASADTGVVDAKTHTHLANGVAGALKVGQVLSVVSGVMRLRLI